MVSYISLVNVVDEPTYSWQGGKITLLECQKRHGLLALMRSTQQPFGRWFKTVIQLERLGSIIDIIVATSHISHESLESLQRLHNSSWKDFRAFFCVNLPWSYAVMRTLQQPRTSDKKWRQHLAASEHVSLGDCCAAWVGIAVGRTGPWSELAFVMYSAPELTMMLIVMVVMIVMIIIHVWSP